MLNFESSAEVISNCLPVVNVLLHVFHIYYAVLANAYFPLYTVHSPFRCCNNAYCCTHVKLSTKKHIDIFVYLDEECINGQFCLYN
jgi:hypothetical protein